VKTHYDPINHVISKELVQFASDFGMGLQFEDLIEFDKRRNNAKKTKSDAGNNRDAWAFYLICIRTAVMLA